jgi:hypothetical protein
MYFYVLLLFLDSYQNKTQKTKHRAFYFTKFIYLILTEILTSINNNKI